MVGNGAKVQQYVLESIKREINLQNKNGAIFFRFSSNLMLKIIKNQARLHKKWRHFHSLSVLNVLLRSEYLYQTHGCQKIILTIVFGLLMKKSSIFTVLQPFFDFGRNFKKKKSSDDQENGAIFRSRAYKVSTVTKFGKYESKPIKRTSNHVCMINRTKKGAFLRKTCCFSPKVTVD